MQRPSRLCPGARCSFFCRMKCKTQATVKEEADTTTGGQRCRKLHSFYRRYSVIHCTGYLKSWASANLSLPEDAPTDDSEGSGPGEQLRESVDPDCQKSGQQ
ncbi:protein cycle-like [Rhipicephalus microplus]|uniref:protein cycle-like n=1 Tax=Rhipicephalus microplus TaxID=6941 RepID=UPI003F6AB489